MGKVALYLQEHILGEVASTPDDTRQFTLDRGVMEIAPEMVAYPRVTSDIRKIARFSWQLAEKGHVLPLTVRGGGSDTTGASLGRGLVISTTEHMHQVFEYDSKQRLVRLQPGTSVATLSTALGVQGGAVPELTGAAPDATVAGLIASGYYGMAGGKYGGVGQCINQLEVVLATGDVLQTGKISKRELNRKKGLQTAEGDIYRKLDNLIEDNAELIGKLADGTIPDRAGYPGIAQVRAKDGSFDLTPLIIGSQGTLGIISEMILKTDFIGFHPGLAVMVFKEKADARDAVPTLRKLKPAFAEYIDGAIFDRAAANGKKFDWFKPGEDTNKAVIVVGFDDMSEKSRKKRLKKLEKEFENIDVQVITVTEEADVAKGLAIRDIAATTYAAGERGEQWPPLLEDFYVPEHQLETFLGALDTWAEKLHMQLPLFGHMLSGVYSIRVPLNLAKVGDRQKVLKLLDEFANLLEHHDGCLVASGGDGRLKAKFALKQLDADTRKLYEAVKDTFDPHGILNPGVKQDVDVRELAKHIRTN